MSDDEKRRLRDEVAELSKAVRDLREQLAQRDAHHCCYGWHSCCGSLHWHGWTNVPPYSPPYTVTIGSTTTTAAPNIMTSSVTSTLPGTITYS